MVTLVADECVCAGWVEGTFAPNIPKSGYIVIFLRQKDTLWWRGTET